MSVRKKIKEWAWKRLGFEDFKTEVRVSISEWRRTLAMEDDDIRKHVDERSREGGMRYEALYLRVVENERLASERLENTQRELGAVAARIGEPVCELNLEVDRLRADVVKLQKEVPIEVSEMWKQHEDDSAKIVGTVGRLNEELHHLKVRILTVESISKAQVERMFRRQGIRKPKAKKPRNAKAKVVK